MENDFLQQQIEVIAMLYKGIMLEYAKEECAKKEKTKLENNFGKILEAGGNFPELLKKIADRVDRVELINKLLTYLTSYEPKDENSLVFKNIIIYYLNRSLNKKNDSKKHIIGTMYELIDIISIIGNVTKLSNSDIINTNQELYQYYIEELRKIKQLLAAVAAPKTQPTKEIITKKNLTPTEQIITKENLTLIKNINAFAYKHDAKGEILTPQQELLNKIQILQKQVNNLPENKEIIKKLRQSVDDLIKNNIKCLQDDPRNINSTKVKTIDNAIKIIETYSLEIKNISTNIDNLKFKLGDFPEDSYIRLYVNNYINEAIAVIEPFDINSHFTDLAIKKVNGCLLRANEMLSLSNGALDHEISALKQNIDYLVIDFEKQPNLKNMLDVLLNPVRNFLKTWDENFEGIDINKIKKNYSTDVKRQIIYFLKETSFKNIQEKITRIEELKLKIMELLDEATASMIINSFSHDIATNPANIDQALANMGRSIMNKEQEKILLNDGLAQLKKSFDEINKIKNAADLCLKENKNLEFENTVGKLKIAINELNNSQEREKASENLVKLLDNQINDIKKYKQILETQNFNVDLDNVITQGILLLDVNPKTNSAFIEFKKSTKPYPTMSEKQPIIDIISENLEAKKNLINEINKLNEQKYKQYFIFDEEEIKINKIGSADYIIKVAKNTLNQLTIAINAYQKTLIYCFEYVLSCGSNKQKLEQQKNRINAIIGLIDEVKNMSMIDKLAALEKIRAEKQEILKTARKYFNFTESTF